MNLLDVPLAEQGRETTTTLFDHGSVRVERIVSLGHRSPHGFWYDQTEHEWVAVLSGKGVIAFEDGDRVTMGPGDTLSIPPHERHRVAWTDPQQPTIWLAVFSGAE